MFFYGWNIYWWIPFILHMIYVWLCSRHWNLYTWTGNRKLLSLAKILLRGLAFDVWGQGISYQKVSNSNCLPENERDASRNAENLPILHVLFFFKCIITSVFAFVNPVLSYLCHRLSITFPYGGSVFLSFDQE